MEVTFGIISHTNNIVFIGQVADVGRVIEVQ